MGVFDSIGTARASYNSNYERAGSYIHVIREFSLGNKRTGEAFLAIRKTCIHVYDDDEGKGHRVGEDLTHMLMVNKDSFLGNVKRIVSDILQCSEEEVTKESCEMLVSADQPLSGTIVRCKNRMTVTKKGNDFTVVTYEPVPAADLKEILTPNEVETFFPGGALDRLIAAEAAAAAA